MENNKQNFMLYSRWLWEKMNGKISVGYFIHHKDGDTLNDCMENYECINRHDHARLHWNQNKDYVQFCLFLNRHGKMDYIKKNKYLLIWNGLEGQTVLDKLGYVLKICNIDNFQQLSNIANIDIGQLSRIKNKGFGLGKKNIARIIKCICKYNNKIFLDISK
jgi:hypothetical protein